ncbi:MAG: DoxX family membrane protein [Propionibacteriaceae bacterium]|nr:DoxX family membrane protein [Propionibacteriaceae bacterium]
MRLFRFLSRSLLAGFFIVDGLKAIRDPEPLLDDATPLVDKVSDVSEKYLPDELTRFLPETTEGFVRSHGFIQIIAALMMATGLFGRLGAAILACTYAPKVVASSRSLPPNLDSWRDLALLGGVLVAASDTQGKARTAWMKAYAKQTTAQVRSQAKQDLALQRSAEKEHAKYARSRTQALRDIFNPIGLS